MPTDLLHDEQLAQLERELQASRDSEETNRTAFRQLRQELKEAYFKIEQQQQKLETFARKLRSGRGADEAAPESGALPSRLADLAHPENFGRWLISQTPQAADPRRCPLPQGETAARLEALWARLPAWTQGTINSEDAGFLCRMIEEVRPEKIYEVGVASGASSALILSTMAGYADPSRTWLHSHDIARLCYFDAAHGVGDATREMVPEFTRNWELNLVSTALDVCREPNSRALFFVDANHDHPWPALDLIALLPGLKAGDRVVLHDINLPTISEGKFPSYGVQYLFEDWLGERLVPDVALANIGAVTIPADRRLVVESLVRTLARPWPLNTSAKGAHLAACDKLFLNYLRT